MTLPFISRQRGRHQTPPPSAHSRIPVHRTGAASLVAAALAVVAPGVLASPAHAVAAPSGCSVGPSKTTCVFDYTRYNSGTFTVPDGVAFVDVTLEGGGGGAGAEAYYSSGESGTAPGAGGAGRLVSGTLPVKPGTVLQYVLGGAGGAARSASLVDAGGGIGGLAGNAWWCGGANGSVKYAQPDSRGGVPGVGAADLKGSGGGGNGDQCFGGGGGGGGGATALYLRDAPGSPVAVAGGGGGGGGGGLPAGSVGGDGGGNATTGYAGEAGAGISNTTSGGAVSAGTPTGGSATRNSGGGGSGGGGGGYPAAGGGGGAADIGGAGGGGGAAGDSWDGGAANTAYSAGAKLLFDSMGMSPRGGGKNGRLTVTYTTPFVQVFTTATPTEAVYQSTVKYTTVVQSDSGVGVPTGTVTFYSKDTKLCSAKLTPVTGESDRSTASCSSTATPFGTAPVSTVYSGDKTFLGTTALGPRVTVVSVPTTVSLSAQPSSAGVGQPVSYTALVTPTAGRAARPAGTVTFTTDTGVRLCSEPLVNGIAGCVTTSTPPGQHVVTAAYTPAGSSQRGYFPFSPSTGTTTVTIG